MAKRKNAGNKRIWYDLSGEYGIGYANKSKKFIFDKEDYDKIKDYHWFFDKYGYVVAYAKNPQHRDIVRFHHLIMGKPPKGLQIDHIRNTEGLQSAKADNRRCNLRFATPAQNCRNRGLRSDNKSGHTGIQRMSDGRIRACVKKDGKSKTKIFPSGQYPEACRWRDETAEELFGEFAYKYDTVLPQKGLPHGAEPGC